MSKRLGWLLLIMFLVLMTFNVTSQIKHNMSKKNSIQEEIKIVNKKIEETTANIAKYDRKIESLDDDFEKERVARNMFQMVKDDEVIYKYVEKDNNPNSIKEEKWKEN